ncbi:zinc finger, CCHC-type containing protein [Tanacetum coccineum]
MHFLLSSISVAYVLTTSIPEDGGDDATNVESSKELWDSLEAKYMAEDASSNKFLVSNFTNYKITDSRPVMEQYNELGILRRFTQHKMNMDEAIQVTCIIDKLPPSWKDFKHILKHLKDELTLVELGSHLRIEESLMMQDSDKPKGNNVVGPSIVNMVEHNNSSRDNINKGKRKHHDNTKVDPNKKSKVTCWKYEKPGHLKNDCKGGKVGNKANGSGTNGLVDGSTVHVCKDRCWFKTYESLNDGSIFHMGNESTALVHGRGCVDLKFSSGKIVSLFNVLHDEALDKFNVLKTEVELQQGSLIKRFRTDRGGEYIDTLYFQSVGIIHETTTPYTPQQNGISEMKNRVMKEMINSMLSYSGLSQGFWGKAMAVVRLPDPKLKTLGERGIECIFVGYAEHLKSFRFYVIEPNDSVAINSIIESRDAIFDEHKFSYVPKPSQRFLVKGNDDSGGDEVSDQHSYCSNVEDDPKTFDKAIKSQNVAFWKEAINDKMDSIMGNNTWVLTDLLLGYRPLGCKWIFKRKLKVDGTVEKFKARLVIQIFKQKSGIDYFDSYTPVAHISNIRLLIAMTLIHSLIIHQMDVKTAFLNEELEEEVYMNQPLGFILPGNENKVCKLVKSLYELKQCSKHDIITQAIDDGLANYS